VVDMGLRTGLRSCDVANFAASKNRMTSWLRLVLCIGSAVNITFEAVGLSWAEHVEVDSRFARAKRSSSLEATVPSCDPKQVGIRRYYCDIIREIILAEEEHGL
jgi:hypothetical protein